MTVFISSFTSLGRDSRVAAIAFLLVFSSRISLASARCGVEFLFPTPDQVFHYLDTVNVTYHSNFSGPTLYAWCQQSSSDPVQKAIVQAAPPLDGWVNVKLDFKSATPCWFDLRPNTPDCGDNSPSFKINPQRGSAATIGLVQASSPTHTSTSASASATHSDPPAESDTQKQDKNKQDGLSVGAQIGLGIGVSILAGLVIGAIAVWLYVRRHRRARKSPQANPNVSHHPYDSWQGQKPRPLLDTRFHDVGFRGSASTGPSAGLSMSSPASYPDQPVDDSFWVGHSGNLPGFYGSAAESGSRHQLPFERKEPHDRPALDNQSSDPYPYLYRSDAHTNDIANTNDGPPPMEFYPPVNPEVAVVRESASGNQGQASSGPSHELPGKENDRGYGHEVELSGQHAQPPHPVGPEVQEQKFLLQDIELMGLKPARSKDRLMGRTSPSPSR